MLVFTIESMAQDPDDPYTFTMTNEYNDFASCLNSNVVDLFQPIDHVESFTSDIGETYLLQVFNLFKTEVQLLIKDSIELTFNHIKSVKNHESSDVIISLHLELLFTGIFESKVAELYSMKLCKIKDSDTQLHFDYIELLKPMINIILETESKAIENKQNNSKLNYFVNDYLFKIAILKYMDEYKNYVDNDLLIEKMEYRIKNKYYDHVEYIWNILECYTNNRK